MVKRIPKRNTRKSLGICAKCHKAIKIEPDSLRLVILGNKRYHRKCMP